MNLIEGVVVSQLRQFHDKRGSVLHMLRKDDPEFVKFGECYFSEILPGSIKAWKRHRWQTQMLAVPVGCIRLVIFDDRKSSSTCGLLSVIEMGRPDAYQRIKIPPLIWYGFSCLSDDAALIANCVDVPHDPEDSESIDFNSPVVPYSWTT